MKRFVFRLEHANARDVVFGPQLTTPGSQISGACADPKDNQRIVAPAVLLEYNAQVTAHRANPRLRVTVHESTAI